jgi:sulfur-oxidizing protein SoxY
MALVSIALFLTFTGTASAQSDKTWNDILRGNIFPDREIGDGDAFLALDTPYRAEDAALVPVGISLKNGAALPAALKSLTLVVDENPSPVVATFTYGPAAEDPAMETRVRVNSYSYVRVIAELADGKLYMVKRFVKASGGCSAPSSSDEDAAAQHLGEMRMKELAAKPDELGRAELMIRHPNNSGLQMNQVTHLYIPAHFVRQIEVKRDGQLVWRMEGGISISENPNFIFDLKPAHPGPQTLSVHIVDTEDKEFDKTFTLGEAAKG